MAISRRSPGRQESSSDQTACQIPVTQTTPAVGVPVAERSLTRALESFAPRLFAPGSGRTLVRLSEVDIGTGRPDAIFLVVSLAILRSRIRADLRLPTIAHARVLESLITGSPAAYCRTHVTHLMNSLYDLGWLTTRRRVRVLRKNISSSFLIEAKLSNWRRGILQLTKARWACHQAALLMPHDTHHRVRQVALEHNRLGLLVQDDDSIDWKINSPVLPLRWSADLWLTELAIRNITTGDNYRFSPATN